jgi:hypothetical protein
MEVIVGPAMCAADRRPPKRPAKNATDHAAGHGANRTGNQKAGSGTGAGANPIGACRRCGDSRGGHQRSRRQQKSFHLVRPPTLLADCMARLARRTGPSKRISHKFVAKLGRFLGRPTARFACTHPPTITCRLISAMLLMPVSAMVTSSSLRMISMARATPACPPAPRPYT